MNDEDLKTIQERNRRVEADKAWETSLTRRLLIASGTYVIVSVYLGFLGVEQACFHAFVPAGAYLISTFSLPFARKIWVKRVYKQKNP